MNGGIYFNFFGVNNMNFKDFNTKKRILAGFLCFAMTISGQGLTSLAFSVRDMVDSYVINKQNTPNYYLELIEEEYTYEEYTEEWIPSKESIFDDAASEVPEEAQEETNELETNIEEQNEHSDKESLEEGIDIGESGKETVNSDLENVDPSDNPDEENNLEDNSYEEEPEEDTETESENAIENDTESKKGADIESADTETENNVKTENESEHSAEDTENELEETSAPTFESSNINNYDDDEATGSESDFEENEYEHTEEVTEHMDIDIDDIASDSDVNVDQETVLDDETATDSEAQLENDNEATKSDADEEIDFASDSEANFATNSEIDGLATNSEINKNLATDSEAELSTKSDALASGSEPIRIATVAKAEWKILDILLDDVSEGLAFQYESSEKIIDKRLATCADVKVQDENGDEMIINVPITWILKEERKTAYQATKQRSALTIEEFKEYMKISEYLTNEEVKDIEGFDNEEEIIEYLKNKYGEDLIIQMFSVASIAELERKLNDKKKQNENQNQSDYIDDDTNDDIDIDLDNIDEYKDIEIINSENVSSDSEINEVVFTSVNDLNTDVDIEPASESEFMFEAEAEEYDQEEYKQEENESNAEEVSNEENLVEENDNEYVDEIIENNFDEDGNLIIASKDTASYDYDKIYADGNDKSGVESSFTFDMMTTNYEPKAFFIYELDLDALQRSVAEVLSNISQTVKTEEERQEKLKNGEKINSLDDNENESDYEEEQEEDLEENKQNNLLTNLFKGFNVLGSSDAEKEGDIISESEFNETNNDDDSLNNFENNFEEETSTPSEPRETITNTEKTVVSISLGSGFKNKKADFISLGSAGAEHSTVGYGHAVCGLSDCNESSHAYRVPDSLVSSGGKHLNHTQLFTGATRVFTASNTLEPFPSMLVKQVGKDPTVIDKNRYYYLAEKIDFCAKWIIPENKVVVICLNGCPFTFFNADSPASSSYIKGPGTLIFTNCQKGNTNESYISKTEQSSIGVGAKAGKELFNTPVQTHNFGLYGLKDAANKNNIKVKDLNLNEGKGQYGNNIYTSGTIENGRGAALFGTYNWDTVNKEGESGTIEKKQAIAGSTVLVSNIDFENIVSTKGNAAIQVFAPGSYQDKAYKTGSETDEMAEKNLVNGTFGLKKQKDIGCFLGVENCNFEKCQSSGYGGALFIANGEAQILNNKFNECTSELDGGAVYISGGRNNPTQIYNCSFTNNKAKFNGAAVGVKNLMGLSIECSTFDNNIAEGSGGALAYYESNYVDQYVYQNQIPGSPNLNQPVGRIITHDPFIRIASVSFTNNSANISGGAVHISDNAGCPVYPKAITKVSEVTKKDHRGLEYTDDTDVERYNVNAWTNGTIKDVNSYTPYNPNKKLKVNIESSDFESNSATNLSAFGGALHVTGNIEFVLGGEEEHKKVTLKNNKAQAGAGIFTQGYEPWHYRRKVLTTNIFTWTDPNPGGGGSGQYFMNPFRLDYKIPIKYDSSKNNPNGFDTENPKYFIDDKYRKAFFKNIGSNKLEIYEDLAVNDYIARNASISIVNVEFEGGSTYFTSDGQLLDIVHKLYEQNQLEVKQQEKRVASYNELDPSYDMFFDMSKEIERKATYTEAFYAAIALKEVKDGATAGAMYLGHRASVSVAKTLFKENTSGVLYVDGADVTVNKTDIHNNRANTYGGIIEYCRFAKNNIKLVSVIATGNVVGDLREQYDANTLVHRDIEKSELVFSGACQIVQNYLASASLPGGIDKNEERDVLVDVGSLNLSWDRGFVPNQSVGVYANNLDEALITDRWMRTNENIPNFGRGITVNDYFYIDNTHLNTDNNFSIYRDNNFVYLGKFGTKVRFVVDIPGSEYEFKPQYIKYNTTGTVVDPPFDPADFSKSIISDHNTFCGFVGNDYPADQADPTKKHVISWDFDNNIVVGTTTSADNKYRMLRAVYTNDDIHLKACGGRNANTWILEEVIIATVNMSTLPNARKVRVDGVDKYEIIEYNEIKTSTDTTAVCDHAGYEGQSHRDRGIGAPNSFAARYLNYIAVCTFSDLFYVYSSGTEKYNTQYVLMNDIIFTDKDEQLDNEKLIYMNGHNIILESNRPLFKLTQVSASKVKKAVADSDLPVGGLIGICEDDIRSGREYPKIIFNGSAKHINYSLIEQEGNNNLILRAVDLNGVTIDDSTRLVKHTNASDINYAGTKTSIENINIVNSTFSTLLEGQVFNLSHVKVAHSYVKNAIVDSKAFGSSLRDVDINNNYFDERIIKIKASKDTGSLKQKESVISSVSIMHNTISTKTSGQGFGMLSISNTSTDAPEANLVIKENFVIATNYNAIKYTPAAGSNDHRIIHFEMTENSAQLKFAENSNFIVRDNVVDYQGGVIPADQHLEYVYFDYGDSATGIKYIEEEGNMYIEDNTYTGNDNLKNALKPILTGVRFSKFAVLRTYVSILRIRNFYNTYEDPNKNPEEAASTTDPYYGARRVIPFFLEPKYVPGYIPILDPADPSFDVADDTNHQLQYIEQMPGKKFKASDSILEAWGDLKVIGYGEAAVIKCHEIRVFKGWCFDNIEGFNNKKLNVSRFVTRDIVCPDLDHNCGDDTRRSYKQEIGNDCYVMFGINFVNVFFVPFNTTYNRYITTPTEAEKEEYYTEYDIDYEDPYRQYFSFMKMQRVANGYNTTLEPVDEVKPDGTVIKYVWKYPYTEGGITKTRFKTFPLDMATASVQATGRDIYVYGRPAEEHTHNVYVGDRLVHYKDEVININPNIATHENVTYDNLPREIIESGEYEGYVNPVTHLYVYRYYGPATITTITYKEGERREDYKEYTFWSPAYDDDENNFNISMNYSPVGREGDALHPLVKQGYRTMNKTEDVISTFDYENVHVVLKEDVTVRSELITAPDKDFAICLDGHNLTIELEEHPDGLGGDNNPAKWFETNIKSGKVIITNCKDTGTVTIKNHASVAANDNYRMKFTNDTNLFLSSVSIVTDGVNPMQPFAHFDNSNFALSNVRFEDNITYNSPVFKLENAALETCDDLNAGPYAKFEHIKLKDYVVENIDPIIDVSNARSVLINDVNVDNMTFSSVGNRFMKFNTMPSVSTASITIKNSTLENNTIDNDSSYIFSIDTNNLVLDHTLFKHNAYKTSLIEKNSTKGIDFENTTYDDNTTKYTIDLEGFDEVKAYRLNLINNQYNNTLGILEQGALIHIKDFVNASTKSNMDEIFIDNNTVPSIFQLEGDTQGFRIKNGKITNNTVKGNGSHGGGIISFDGNLGNIQDFTIEGSKRIVASTSIPEGATKSVTEYVVDDTSEPLLEIKNNKLTSNNGVIHGSTSSNTLYLAGDVRVYDNKHYLDASKQVNILTSDKYILSHREIDEKIAKNAKIYLTARDIEVPVFKYWTDKHIASINTPLYYPAENVFVIDDSNYKGGEEDAENPGQYKPFIYKKGTVSNVELWFGKDYEQLIYVNTFESDPSTRLIAKQFVANGVDTTVDKVIKDDVPIVYQTWAGPKAKGEPGEIIWRPYLIQNEVRLSTTSYVNLTLHGHENPSTHEVIYYRGAFDINDLYMSSESNIFIAGDTGLSLNELVDFAKFSGKILRICLLGRDLIINQNQNIFDVKEGYTLDISDCLTNGGMTGRLTTRDASIAPLSDKKVFIKANGGNIKLNQIKIASINIVDNTRVLEVATNSNLEIDNLYIEGIHSVGANEAINIEKAKLDKIENLHITNNNLSYPVLKVKDLETEGHKLGLKNLDVNNNIVEKGAVEFTGLDISLPNTGVFNIDNNTTTDIAPVVFKDTKVNDEATTKANDNIGVNGSVFYLDNSSIKFGAKKAVFNKNIADYGTCIYQKGSTHDTNYMEFNNNTVVNDGIVYFDNPVDVKLHNAKFVGSIATDSSIIYVKLGTNSIAKIDSNSIDGTNGGTVDSLIKIDGYVDATNLNAQVNIANTTVTKTTLRSIYKVYNIKNSTFETGTLTFNVSNAFTDDSNGYLYTNNAELTVNNFPAYTNMTTYAPYITVENKSHITYKGNLTLTGNTLLNATNHIINVKDSKFTYTGNNLQVTNNKTILGPIGVSGDGIFYIHDTVNLSGNKAYNVGDKSYDVYLEDNGKLAGEAINLGSTIDSLGRHTNQSRIKPGSIINFYRDPSSIDGPVYQGWDWYYIEKYNRATQITEPFYFPEHFVTMHASLSEAGYRVYKRGTGSETEIWIGNDYEMLEYKAGTAIIATQYVASGVPTKVDFVYADSDDIEVQAWMGPDVNDETALAEWYYIDEGNNTCITTNRMATLFTHEHQLCGCTSTLSCPHGEEYHHNYTFSAISSLERLKAARRQYLALCIDLELSEKITLTNQNTTICLNGHTLSFRRGTNIFNLEGKSLTITDCQHKLGKMTVYDDGNAGTEQNIFAKASTIKLINTRIASANILQDGQMIRVYNANSKLEMIDTIIEDNHNDNESLMYVSDGNLTLKDVKIRNNNSTQLKAYIINAKSENINISGLDINNNFNGRHIFNFDTVRYTGYENVNIVNNTTEAGSIFNIKNSGTINIDYPININGNTTGTGLYTIYNTTMNVNNSINVQNTVGKKGAIFYLDNNAVVNIATSNIVVNNNTAEQGGFAYIKSGKMVFKEDTILTGNKASDKGTVFYLGSAGGLDVAEGKTLEITGNSAVTAGTFPGDIYIDGGYFDNKGLINIHDNSGVALIYDGSNAKNTLQNIIIDDAMAINAKDHENLIIKNATISGCDTGILGSALTIEDAKVTLGDNTHIINNTNAFNVNGGELVIDGAVDISNNTGDAVIKSNTSKGGTIRFYNGSIVNNTVTDVYNQNLSDTGSQKIYIYFGGSMKVNNNGTACVYIQDDTKEICNGDTAKPITKDFNVDVKVYNRDTKILARSNTGIVKPDAKTASAFNAHQDHPDSESPAVDYKVYDYEGDTYIGYPKIKLTLMANNIGETGASFYDTELTGNSTTLFRKTYEEYRKVNEKNKMEKGVTYGLKIGDIPTPKKAGHTFIKYTVAGSTSSIDKNSLYNWTNEPDTLYAHFKPNNYIVRFDPDYHYSDPALGIGITGTMDDIIATYGELFTLPANNYIFEFDGEEKNFLGWKLESYYDTVEQRVIPSAQYNPGQTLKNLRASQSEIVVFKAMWDAPKFKLKVKNEKLQDLIQFASNEYREIYYGDIIGERLEDIDYTSLLYEPHVHGWSWTEATKSYTEAYVAAHPEILIQTTERYTYMTDRDIYPIINLVYAKFIYENADGGVWTAEENNGMKVKARIGQVDDGVLYKPTRSGWEFVGWEGPHVTWAASNSDVITFTVNEDDILRYKAHWRRQPVTIKLDANGGELIGEETITKYTDEYVRFIDVCEREGYKLLGFAIQKNAGPVNYPLNTDFLVSDIITAGTITLFARWQKKGIEENPSHNEDIPTRGHGGGVGGGGTGTQIPVPNTHIWTINPITGKWHAYDATTGEEATGWKAIAYSGREAMYYFEPNGDMHTGWLYQGKKYYYFGEDGCMAGGDAFEIDGKIYTFDDDGELLGEGDWMGTRTNFMPKNGTWVKDTDGNWQYLILGNQKDFRAGDYYKGIGKIGDFWYCFNDAGKMITGLYEINGQLYYFNNEEGANQGMLTLGFVEIDGDLYYFDGRLGGALTAKLPKIPVDADQYHIFRGSGVAETIMASKYVQNR